MDADVYSAFTFADLLDEKFQEALLAVLSMDEDFLVRARAIITPNYFSAEVYQQICQACFNIWDQEGVLPEVSMLRNELAKAAPDLDTREAWIDVLNRIRAIPGEERRVSYVARELCAFAQRAQAASAVALSYHQLRTFDIAKLTHRLREIEGLRAQFEDLGYRFWRNYPDVFMEDNYMSFPTGWQEFDGAMRGGMREGELITFMARLKGGKSMALVNVGVGLMIQGFNVVHYTLEMRSLDVLRRYLACITSQPINTINAHIATIEETLQELRRFTTADLIVKEFGARTVDVAALEAHLALLSRDDKRWVPIVDYGDLLLGPNRRAEEWTELGEIWMALRNLGREYGVPVITATQTNAGGFTATELGAQHQAGSTRKGFHSDYMWAINQNDMDYQLNRLILSPFLNRNDRKNRSVYMFHDYACARLREVSETEWKAKGASLAAQPDDHAPKKGRSRALGN